jgi:SMODS-associating 2TM, beta-strand rich effector domain
MGADRFTKAIIYIAAAAWTIVLFINHEPLKPALLNPLSIVVTVVVWLVILFDLWLWKLRLLHPWFVKRPVIDGTWKVEFRSDYTDPATGAPTPPLEGYMVIKQTHSTLTMRLLTAESSSQLVGNEIVCATDGSYCVSGVYRNEPRLSVQDRSRSHYGGIQLKVVEEPEQELIGHYWTDRKTAGEIELTQRQKERFQTFQAAKKHYDKLRPKE